MENFGIYICCLVIMVCSISQCVNTVSIKDGISVIATNTRK